MYVDITSTSKVERLLPIDLQLVGKGLERIGSIIHLAESYLVTSHEVKSREGRAYTEPTSTSDVKKLFPIDPHLVPKRPERIGSIIHLAEFWVLNNSTIAAKLLLEVFQNLVVAEFFLQSLNGSQTFPSISLLNTDVHILFRACACT